jgi:hypothetical protein
VFNLISNNLKAIKIRLACFLIYIQTNRKIMTAWQNFLSDLALIEAKYWQHFRRSKLSDHYILNEDENEILRFGFKKNSDLPTVIKEECFEIYKRYGSEQQMA